MNKLETMKAHIAVLRDETAKSRQDIDGSDRAHSYFNSLENRIRHIEDVLTSLIADSQLVLPEEPLPPPMTQAEWARSPK